MGITAEHIIKTIQDKNLQQQFFDNDNWEYIDYELDDFNGDYKLYLESIGLPTSYDVVDGRCDTSEFWSVVDFPIEDIFIKITGWYDSYGQYEHTYDDKVIQVFPKQVIQTVYEK